MGVRLEVALSLFNVPVSSDRGDVHFRISAYRRALEIVNKDLYDEYLRDMDAAFTALRNEAKYLRLDPKGPQEGPISYHKPLNRRYFKTIRNRTNGMEDNRLFS